MDDQKRETDPGIKHWRDFIREKQQQIDRIEWEIVDARKIIKLLQENCQHVVSPLSFGTWEEQGFFVCSKCGKRFWERHQEPEFIKASLELSTVCKNHIEKRGENCE
jgi:hypothetical protein